jgi:hypothetical protein
LIVTLLIFGFLLRSTAAETIEDEKGFYLGLRFAGSSLHIEEDPDADFYIKDGGGGLHFDIGYRFNPTFMLELSFGGATHSTSDPAIDARLEEVQIFGYYRFSPEKTFRPYLKGGFGGYGFYVDAGSSSWRVKGGGVTLGGGFRFFFSPHFSLGLDLTHNIIGYDSAEIALEGFSYEWEIDEDGSSTSLGVIFGYSF